MTPRPVPVPLLLGRKVVATGTQAQMLDLCARLRERGIDTRVPATCDGCGHRRRSVPVVTGDCERALCALCYRRVAAGELLPIDHETEAERRGGAEPE